MAGSRDITVPFQSKGTGSLVCHLASPARWMEYSVCTGHPAERTSYRHALPSEWYGLRGEELSAASGVADAKFCHPSGFLAGADSQEGALEWLPLHCGNKRKKAVRFCSDSLFLFQIFTVGSDDFLIPEEGIFSASGEITRSIIITVNIDEAVSLIHFTGPGRD